MTEEAAKPPIQVLIVTGMTDVHHKWRETTPALATLLADTGRFEVHVTEEFRGAGPETLEGYDLVLLNYYGRFEPWGVGEERRFGERTERALFDFVRAGGGLIPYHATLQGGVGWEEFERVAGLVLRDHTSRRAPNNDFQVRVAAPDHPITRGWPASFPHYQDDLYVEMVRHPEAEIEVLLTAWDNPLRYTQVPSQWDALPGMGTEQPAAWVARYGEGRVLGTSLGHGVEAIGHPGFRALLTRGAEWAATGEVTLPIPAGLGEPVEGGDWWPTVLEPMVRTRYDEWLANGRSFG